MERTLIPPELHTHFLSTELGENSINSKRLRCWKLKPKEKNWVFPQLLRSLWNKRLNIRTVCLTQKHSSTPSLSTTETSLVPHMWTMKIEVWSILYYQTTAVVSSSNLFWKRTGRRPKTNKFGNSFQQNGCAWRDNWLRCRSEERGQKPSSHGVPLPWAC